MTIAHEQALFGGAFHGARVLVTGHTGFKGSWLCEWLLALGAQITGLALEPDTTPALFTQLGLASRVRHIVGDVRSPDVVRRIVAETSPDFVFHLAAQPLVRRSYRKATYTWETNVLGTVHVLDALRQLDKPCAAVMVTTDKCYENREWLYGYRENDPLGGHDPYSSSKAAAELAIASWRNSFFASGDPVRIASARAGNVIGGGDWAEDRIAPDCARAVTHNNAIAVRNKTATRPWQHVLEPLSGYLWLAAVLANPTLRPYAADLFTSAFNFGPSSESNRTVVQLVEAFLRHWPGQWADQSDPAASHEAGQLSLATDKALQILGWEPCWDFEDAVLKTATWYRRCHEGWDPAELTRRDLDDYEALARQKNICWMPQKRKHCKS
ncbi:MAG: CDP-glucose 4,6-dehydratase [Pirellulales bacterium]